jgi:RNA polymerase sigma-70 factor, ECF subfamily
MVRRSDRCDVVAAMNETTLHAAKSLPGHAAPHMNTEDRAGQSTALARGAHVLTVEDLRQVLPRMRARARYLTTTREDAEDLVQDTLLYVLRRPRIVAQEDATAYLLRAVRNMWISQHRRQRLAWPESLDERHEAIAVSGPDPTAFIEEEFAWSAVKALPQPYRDAVAAVVLCDLSYREAADVLGVPIGTIMSRLYRGRRLLEPALQEAA